MPAKEEPKKPTTRRQRPATTPEDREKQMINYAERLAEQQLLDGSAPAQVVIHYLKLGSTREGKEQAKLLNENLRLEAQVAEIQSRQNSEEMLAEVLKAVRTYAGVDDDEFE